VAAFKLPAAAARTSLVAADFRHGFKSQYPFPCLAGRGQNDDCGYLREHRTAEQQTELAVIRARDAILRARTLLINTARGIAKGFGVRLPKSITNKFGQRAIGALSYHTCLWISSEYRRNGKEVQRGDDLAVIGQEGQPPLARISAPTDTAQIPGYGPLRNGEAQLQKFAVYFRRSPSRVFFCHAPD
jgi:hypothetical protein